MHINIFTKTTDTVGINCELIHKPNYIIIYCVENSFGGYQIIKVESSPYVSKRFVYNSNFNTFQNTMGCLNIWRYLGSLRF